MYFSFTKERRILVLIDFFWSWHQVPMKWESPFLTPKWAFLPGWEENDMGDALSHTWNRWLVKTTLIGINSASAYPVISENTINLVPSWVFFHISGLLKPRAVLNRIHTFISFILQVFYLNSCLFPWVSGYFLHAGLLRKTGLTRND